LAPRFDGHRHLELWPPGKEPLKHVAEFETISDGQIQKIAFRSEELYTLSSTQRTLFTGPGRALDPVDQGNASSE